LLFLRVITENLNKFSLYIFLLVPLILFSCTKSGNEVSKKQDSAGTTALDDKKSPITETGGNLQKKLNDELVIKSADGKDISASYFYEEGKKDSAEPLVILVHQLKQSKEQWSSEFIKSLQTAGCKVLAYDIRGHGKSSKQDGELSELLSDPEQAPKDIEAVVKWASEQKGIDASRIAVVGTSIGGNIGLYAKFRKLVKAAIAISNGKGTFESFTGYNEAMMGRPYFERFSNVLLVCGSKDDNCEAGQKWIYDNFLDIPKEMKIYDSDKHGKSLIEERPDA
jgi:dienelactone hydrolase